MRSISATDAKQKLAALLDAAQREPVVIRRHDRDVAVILSADEYGRLLDARASDFQSFCDRIGNSARKKGITEAKLAALLEDDAS
jgi:prevent-host-death family protein